MTKMNVPKLRFKGFSEEWEEDKLSKIAIIHDGVHQTPKYVSQGVPFYSVENIKSMKTDKYISQDDYENDFGNKKAQTGDILMSRIGSVGETNIVKFDNDISYYVTLALIKPNKEMIESKFLNYLMNSNNVQSEIWRRTLHVAFPQKINKNEISKIPLKITLDITEQQKIGSIFEKIDKLIELQSKKLEALNKLKKGYLQKMFPQGGDKVPRLRFKGFSEEWDSNFLRNVVDRLDSKRVPIKESEREIGEVPYYGANGIQGYIKGYTHSG